MHSPIILAVLSAVALGFNEDVSKLKAVFGDGEAQKLLAKPMPTVRAYRLADDSHFEETVDRYKEIAGPIDVDGDLGEKVANLLLDPDSYSLDSEKDCLPDYGVRVQFIQGDKSVDVVFCFDCNMLLVYYQGKAVGGEDFDKIRPQLVGVMKKMFPDDKVIQGLKERI